jgi:predicted dehydrogenase
MRDWRRNTGASGGFMLEKCVHDLDLYAGLLGCRPMQVASFGGKKTFVPSNKPDQDLPKPDVQGRLYPYEPRFNGAKDAFNSDADIIDYQTAIIQYENGTSLSFHTNLNAPDESRHFKVMGNKAMAQGDFVKNNFQLHDSVTYKCLVDHQQVNQEGTGHYGADAAMVEDLVDHMKNGTPLPVSILDALEAGICAIKIDEARISQTVIDLTMTWEKFDSYKLPEGNSALTTAQLSPTAIRTITP